MIGDFEQPEMGGVSRIHWNNVGESRVCGEAVKNGRRGVRVIRRNQGCSDGQVELGVVSGEKGGHLQGGR